MDLITKGGEHNNMNEMGAIDIDIDIDNLNEINFFFFPQKKKHLPDSYDKKSIIGQHWFLCLVKPRAAGFRARFGSSLDRPLF
jgi:hypothetical protein